MKAWIGGLLLAGLALAPAGAAQEAPPPQAGETRIDAGDSLIIEQDGVRAMFLTGRVRVKRADFEMTAERAVAWIKEGAKQLVQEIYAEGNVVIQRGDKTLRAERIYFDLARDRAYIVEFRAREYSPKHQQSVFVTAKEARMTFGRMEIDEVSVTTCSYGVPHYHFEIGKAVLRGKGMRPREPGTFDFWPFDETELDAERIYPRLMEIPIFFLPGLGLGSWVKEFPIRGVSGGRSSRFGTYIYTDLGVTIRKDVDGHRPRTWGEILGEADWREERGGGYGLDLEYQWENYEGFIDTYYLYDLGRENDVSFEEKFAPIERPHRGRVRTFHRHELDENWRLELEASYLSDRDLLEEFFEKEFKEGKEPETAAYVRWRDGNFGGFLLERHRLNDFQTQNEYLPRVDVMALQEPVGGSTLDNLYLTERLDVAHVRRRWDEELHLESTDTWRTDLLTEIAMPWDFGVFQLSPFVQQRLTVYDDDLEGETEFRSIWTAGGRFLTQLHATHPDVRWDLVGVRGLRHVAELEARYANSVDSTMAASEVFPFEEVDELGEFEEVALELRQRFLTRNEHGKALEFLSVLVSAEYYPDPDRDTASANVNNHQFPFNWIGLAPDDDGTFERRHWSNLHYDVELRPRNILRARWAGEYNPLTHHQEVREAGVAVQPWEGLSLAAAHTFVRGVTDAYTFEAASALSEKWAASASVQYDFQADEYVSQSLVVSRDCHDFLIQGVVEHDFGRDERRVYVTFVPTFLGKSGLRRSKLAPAGKEMP